MSDRRTTGSKGIGPTSLFAVVYATSAAAIYFALGAVADRALGLTPVVFLVGGLFLGLAAMSYAEGALNHREPGGSSMFARHAFNELVSFSAGWVVILDFLVVMALAAVAAADYAGTLWRPLGHGIGADVVSIAVIVSAAVVAIRSPETGALRSRIAVAIFDIGVQLLLVILGMALVFEPSLLTNSIDLGSTPQWSDVVYALTLVTVAFTGLEAAASLSPETNFQRGAVGRTLTLGVAVIIVLQVGVAAVALSALPVTGGQTALGTQWLDAPLVGAAQQVDPSGIGPTLAKVVAVSAVAALFAAVQSAMLAVSRLGYSLTRSRQIPRIVGRLSGRYGTPWMIIGASGAGAIGLAIPGDIKFLLGVYAFGAMYAVTVAHASVVRMRMRGDAAADGWKMPLSLKIAGREIPLPALFGAALSAGAFVTVLVMHVPARWLGGAWLGGGILLYIAYRRATGNGIFERVEVSERALVYEPESASFGSILVPVLGSLLDDDIVQTAGRLAGSNSDEADTEGSAIEAIWFHQIPMALPLDAPLAEAKIADAKQRLLRAKAVGEEYSGVTVSTAQVRVRKVGEGIVREARRRGVEVIVLSAEDPQSGGPGSMRRNAAPGSIGEVTRYVLRKAHCRVVLTIPSISDTPTDGPQG